MEKTGEFWVDVAQTDDEVLEKVQEQEPDILIMDVILPGLDGLSALRELQELGYAPMTILTSAFVSDQTLAEATELGAAYFLPKPFRMDTLLDRMRNLFWEKPKATRPSQCAANASRHPHRARRKPRNRLKQNLQQRKPTRQQRAQ